MLILGSYLTTNMNKLITIILTYLAISVQASHALTVLWPTGGGGTHVVTLNIDGNGPIITSPVPGSILTSSTVNFYWKPKTGSTFPAYYAAVGVPSNLTKYFQQLFIKDPFTVSGLPTTCGQTIVVTVCGGDPECTQYTYHTKA